MMQGVCQLGYEAEWALNLSFMNCELTPQKVAALVPMSGRRLHDAFKKHVGRSIYQVITHRRIKHALKLLQSTQDKLWVIAESAGFNSPDVMSRIISRELGKPLNNPEILAAFFMFDFVLQYAIESIT